MTSSNQLADFPEDFQQCVQFHGHVCPGLAIGYSAVKAVRTVLTEGRAPDEEIVAVVENDSCAVDAIQILLGCTFGKGNLVFLKRGKQVFTVMDRKTGRAVRVSLKRPMPYSEERYALKALIDSGKASEADKERWSLLRLEAVRKLVVSDPREFFEIREVQAELPPKAQVVATVPCDVCGEATVRTLMLERDGKLLCGECALSA